MPPLLVYVLCGVLIALTVTLIPLLQQLHRTAVSAERFLDGARDDLRRIQEDVRAARERQDALVDSAQAAIDQLNGLARQVGDVGASLKGLVGGLLGRGLMGGIAALFRRSKKNDS